MKLTQEKLLTLFPLINSRELERKAGLRVRRIANVKVGKSTLSEAELETIRKILSKILD